MIRFLTTCFIVGSFSLTGCARIHPGPNVVLIVVDTLRADHLGLYGFPAPTSPHLDRLARESAVFDRAIAASTATAPSHASMMTSLFVREHSIGYKNGTTRLDREPTLAESFQTAGYDTAAFISNIVIRARVGLDRGFDLYDDELPDPERNRPDFFERNASSTTLRAVEWLRKRQRKPFFLWIHYQDPHGPYTPPERDIRAISVPSVPEEHKLPFLDNQSGEGGIPAYQRIVGTHQPQQYRRRYAAEIRHFDSWLGQLLAEIEAQETDRGTIVLVTADHGESLGEDGVWFAHGHATTPDLARIPLLIRARGVSPGRFNQIVHHVDVMPTLLGLAGIPAPDGLRGIDLSGLLREESNLPQRSVFCDIGTEVSVYSGNHFLRIRGISRGGEHLTSQNRFRWSDAGGFLTRGDGRIGAGWRADPEVTELPRHVADYLASQAEMVPIPAASQADTERLRSLGYVEPQ